MKSITYGGLTFGDSGRLRLISIDPNSIGTDVTSEKALGQNGVTTHEITYNARTITCKLALYGDSEGHWSRNEAKGIWQDVMRTLAPHMVQTMTYFNGIGRYKIDCYPASFQNPVRVVGARYDFSVDFVADWPFWRDCTPSDITVHPGESVTFYNSAPLPAPITVTLNGPCASETITNTTTGEKIAVSQSISDGSTFRIDTQKQRAYLDGAAASYKLGVDSTYLRLQPGANVLTVSGSVPAQIQFSQIYLGV